MCKPIISLAALMCEAAIETAAIETDTEEAWELSWELNWALDSLDEARNELDSGGAEAQEFLGRLVGRAEREVDAADAAFKTAWFGLDEAAQDAMNGY